MMTYKQEVSSYKGSGQMLLIANRADNQIVELKLAIKDIVDCVEGWSWGWDGNCGIDVAIGDIADKVIEK